MVTAQESAIQDLTIPDAPVYTDYHQKHISVPALRPGDTLEYQYVRTIVNPLAPGQFWTSHNFTERGIVLDEQLEINVPKDRELKLKTKPGYEPTTTVEGDRRIYRWTHSHLKDEDDAKKTKKRGRDPDEIPSVQLTTFQSWQQLGDWYGTLEADRRQPNEAIKAKAESLTEGKTDDMAKVKALYDYVSHDYRYVSLSFGLGRYQPHAASEVLNLGYGDCKDKNTLLAALLQAEGFTATSVLINAERNIDPDIPSPSQFDHVITRVPVGGQEIWLDSTSGVAPFRMLSYSLRDKLALAIPPGGKPELVRTPADLPFPAFDRVQITGALNDTGKLTAHVSTTVRGDNELLIRYALRQIPANRRKDFFEATLRNTAMRGGEVTNLQIVDPTNTDVAFQMGYDVAVGNYFDWSAREPKLPLPFSNVSLGASESDDESGKPLKLGSPQDGRLEMTLTLPDKYVAHLPLAVDLKRDYAEYHSSYTMVDNRIMATREMKILVRELPYSRRDDWAAFRRTVDADQEQYIRLENKSPGTAGLSATSSADELFESGVQALQNRNYELAVELLQRVQKNDPSHKGLWTGLGQAYLGLNQDEKAVEAFKKQIAINAYDPEAYNDLGLAYERQQKYDEAVEQFKKQIEVNPLDQNAHGNLGFLYSERKQFPEAAAELEKAVSIQPNNPILLIALGQAYIATDQTQRGLNQFERATNLAPNPLTWNNIAYSLAEQSVQLPRADRYADTAINALETQLRDVKLDGVRPADLATSLMLFNVWDTKGWVTFKLGNLDEAEDYIRPAWLASGSGAEAEHLGEIAEIRGKRDEAAHDYILALAADSPSYTAKSKLALLGVTGGLERKIEDARKELKAQRTIKLDATQQGSADFLLLISPEKVEDVKFVKGEESFRAFTEMLKNLSVPMKFPAKSQGHVVRRATLICGTVSVAAKPTPAAQAKPKPKGGGDMLAEETESGPATAASGGLPGPCRLEMLPAAMVHGID